MFKEKRFYHVDLQTNLKSCNEIFMKVFSKAFERFSLGVMKKCLIMMNESVPENSTLVIEPFCSEL